MRLGWVPKRGLDFDLQINLLFSPSRKENPSFHNLTVKMIIQKRKVQESESHGPSGPHCVQLFHLNALTSF